MDEPKKVEPNPIKISLNHNPEKMLPNIKTHKAKKILLLVCKIFCIIYFTLLLSVKKVK